MMPKKPYNPETDPNPNPHNIQLPLARTPSKMVTEDGEIVDVVTREPVAMVPPFWKTPWNHDTTEEAQETATFTPEPSKTQQQFAKDADINVILAKFMKTGELPLTGAPNYQDAESEFDLMDQMVTGYDVDQAWNALPTAVRAILGTPKKFVEYIDHCMSTGDLDPLRELGLAKAKAQEQTPATPAPPLTPGGSPAPGADKAPPEAPKTPV